MADTLRELIQSVLALQPEWVKGGWPRLPPFSSVPLETEWVSYSFLIAAARVLRRAEEKGGR